MEASYRCLSNHATIAISKRKPWPSTSQESSTNGLEDILHSVMEHGLSLVGEGFAQVIFYNLDTRYSLREPEILRKPERFVQALRDMFGDGARIIEGFIKQAMCKQLGLSPSVFEKASLPDCIRKAFSSGEIGYESSRDLLVRETTALRKPITRF